MLSVKQGDIKYQRLKKCSLILPCPALRTIRWGSRVKRNNPRNGVAPSLTPFVVAFEKGAFRSPSTKVAIFSYIYIYIYIHVCVCVCVCVCALHKLYNFVLRIIWIDYINYTAIKMLSLLYKLMIWKQFCVHWSYVCHSWKRKLM